MENIKTILIVDDEDTNIDILTDLLDNEYDIMVAIDGEFALELINNNMPDLILLDIMMPNMDGYEVCQKLKLNPKTKDIPIIFLTAKTDEESIKNAYEIGGSDYVSKPFKPRELFSRVKKELKYKEMVEELKLLASTDPMTKLYNRRYFTKISEHALDLSKREKQNLSIIMIDIDKFKNINDTYGHQVGDDVIITLANKLIEHQRKSDVVCRYGGEEFVVLLPNTSEEGSKIVAEKIRKDVEDLNIKLLSDENLKFTVSLGISKVDLENDDNIESALKRADDALYKAKESGRNKVYVYK